MDQGETADPLRDALCTAWHLYVDALVPVRPALHGYCRRLTATCGTPRIWCRTPWCARLRSGA